MKNPVMSFRSQMRRQMAGFFVWRSRMPYALFCQEAKISKAYPSESDVWKHAAQNGLVVDVSSTPTHPTPSRVLDNSYEIKPCSPDGPDRHDPNATDFELDGIVTT